MAKTSLGKGKKLCEAAAKADQPAPKTVYVDKNEMTVSDASLTFRLRVKKSDDSSVRLTCAVDRETDAATLAPAQ